MLDVHTVTFIAAGVTDCLTPMQCLLPVCYPTKELLLIGFHQTIMSKPSNETCAIWHQHVSNKHNIFSNPQIVGLSLISGEDL